MQVPSHGAVGLEPGVALGSYRLEQLLGEGAMGVVFRARRTSDGAVVALKVLKPALSRDAGYRKRFHREVRVAREVRHRHLVPILEACEERGYDYLAVDYVEGISLADRIEADGPLDLADVARLTAGIGAAIDALHAAGIVHRDVKPANIMIDEAGTTLLTDFGLAKGRAYTVLTKPGELVGTLDYIAPELITGKDAAPASDVYALGCVVYEALTGAPPFGDRRLFEVALAHLQTTPEKPSAQREELPPALDPVVLQALAKEPAERPRTGTAFAHLLRAAAAPAG
jgi:serine/threonine protein kinase